MKEMTLPAVVENIAQVTDFVNAQLEEIGCPMKAQVQIDIAIERAVRQYRAVRVQPGSTGPATVRVEVSDAPISVTITFMDHGVPYDPLQKKIRTSRCLQRSAAAVVWGSSWSEKRWMRSRTNIRTGRTFCASARIYKDMQENFENWNMRKFENNAGNREVRA